MKNKQKGLIEQIEQIDNVNKRTYTPVTEKDIRKYMTDLMKGPIPRDPITGRWMKRQPKKHEAEYLIFGSATLRDRLDFITTKIIFDEIMKGYGK